MKKNFLMPLFLFIFLFFLFFHGFTSISEGSNEEEKKSLETAIMRSTVHCYAVEGRYPESLSYLTEHYGITYDTSKYVIEYEIIGSNLMPSITVIPLKKGDELF